MENNRRKKIFFLLSTYIIILTTPKIKAHEEKITFNETYAIEENYPFATYKNHDIYINTLDRIEHIIDEDSKDIYIIDDRRSKDPDMTIYNSYQIKTRKEMLQILKILLEYEKAYPSRWNRTISSMEKEWIVHNICYFLNIQIERTSKVDFNNKDEDKFQTLENILKEIFESTENNTNTITRTKIKK